METITTRSGITVALLSHGDPSLSLLAIKISQGKVKGDMERLDYYLNVYKYEKPDKLVGWLKGADKGFPSVLEHYHLTFYINGCSRACMAQFTRHRLASFTVSSLRYSPLLDMETLDNLYDRALHEMDVDRLLEMTIPYFQVPPSVRGGYDALNDYLNGIWDAVGQYLMLVYDGVPYEDARMVLPLATRVEMMVSMNLREFLHIYRLRKDKKAQWEIREVVNAMAQLVERVDPYVGQLLEVEDGA